MDKAQLQIKVTSLRAQMNDLVNAATKEKRDLTVEEATKFDGYKGELESTKRNIDRLLALEGENRTLNTNPNAQIDPAADQGTNPLDVSQHDLSKYSFMRALRCLVRRQPVDGLEGEISAEIAKRSGKPAQGFYMYGSAGSFVEARAASQREKRDLTASTGVGGINQTVLFQSFIDKLRNRTLVDKVGTRFMAGLVGKFYIPRQSGTASSQWVGEEGAASQSNQTLDQVALAPNTLSCWTDVSRQFVEQTSLDAESFVRDDLAKVMAIEIDRAAFTGNGLSNQPTGILHNSGITHAFPAGGGGAALTWNDMVGMETTLATANADIGALAYVTNNKVRGALKTALRSSVAGAKYIWDDDNTINGYPAFSGNNIPSNLGAADSEGAGALSTIMFGDWEDLIIAMWGGLDIIVDPYTNSKSGGVRVVALQDIDIKVRHNESFLTIDEVLA